MSVKSTALLVLATALAVSFIPRLLKSKLPPTYSGHVEPGFEKVFEVFRKNIESGKEPGASFALYYKGKLVVNIWGGYADEEFMLPWKKDTIAHFWSGTKFFGAVMVAMLVDRGFLDYEQTVATYWPEFAANGKENVKVKELLSHQAGLAATDETFDYLQVLEDPEKFGKFLARQKPLWKLGTGSGYHALTFGLYVDQLIRRADPKHRSAQVFFKEEIAKPFGVDFFVGLPFAENYRLARESTRTMTFYNMITQNSISQTIRELMPSEMLKKVFKNLKSDFHATANHPDYRSVGIVSFHGYGTAAAAAKVAGILASGGKASDGRVLLSKEAIKRLNTVEVSGPDKVIPMEATFGPGVLLLHPWISATNYTCFGHFGYGCKSVFGDVDTRLGFSYLTNFMSPLGFCLIEQRHVDLVKAVYESVEQLRQ